MQPKVNILFIEDERNILTFVTKLLYGHNYKVTTAITGTGGLPVSYTHLTLPTILRV